MEALINYLDVAEIYALGWTLVHSLWQGAAAMVVLTVVLRLVPGRFPEIRYNAAGVVLIALLAAMIFTYSHYWNAPLQGEPSYLLVFGDSSISRGGESVVGLIDEIPALFPYLVLGWIIGSVIMGVRTTGSLLHLKVLASKERIYLPESWRMKMVQLKNAMGIKKEVRFFLTSHVTMPSTVGFIKPVVYFPISIFSGLQSEQIEAILLHELAHVRRHDFVINIIQSFIESLLFFNPAVWYISNVIREERECSCDKLALSIQGDELNYAKTLTEIELSRLKGQSLMMGIMGQKQTMLTRIQRIMGKKSTQKSNMRFTVLLMIMIAAALISWKTIQIESHEEPPVEEDFAENIRFSSTPTPEVIEMDTIPANSSKSEREAKLEQQVESMRKEIEGLRQQLSETERSDLKELHTEIEKLHQLEELKVLKDLNLQMERIAELNSKIIEDIEPVDMDIDIKNMQSVLEIAQLEMQKSLKEVERVRELEMRESMEVLKQSMQDIKFDKMEIKKDMERMKKEMDIFREKLDAFKVALTEELREDGILRKSEKLREMEVRNGQLISVNGKKIKGAQADKYNKMIKEYLGDTEGNFSFKE